MGRTFLWRSSVAALALMLLVAYSAVLLGFEIGAAAGLHVVKNIWLDLAGGMAILIVPTTLYAVTLAIGEDDSELSFFPGVAVALCGLIMSAQTYKGLNERALHEHGRQMQAIVSRVYSQDNGPDPPTPLADFTDLSGRPVPGELSDPHGLKVGQRVTITVDPAGKEPMVLGTPTGDEAFRVVKIAGGIEVLLLVWPAWRGAVVLLRKKKPRKPQDSQHPQEPSEPRGAPASRAGTTP